MSNENDTFMFLPKYLLRNPDDLIGRQFVDHLGIPVGTITEITEFGWKIRLTITAETAPYKKLSTGG